MLKFAIPLFIIGVLLLHNGSGQARWCPGSGPPLVPRSKHPLKQPKKRMLRSGLVSPEKTVRRQVGHREEEGHDTCGSSQGFPQQCRPLGSSTSRSLTHQHDCQPPRVKNEGSSLIEPTTLTSWQAPKPSAPGVPWMPQGPQLGSPAPPGTFPSPAPSVFPSLGCYCPKTPSVVWKVLANT